MIVGPVAVLWVRQLRIHQWVKNLLIGLPAVASFEIQKPTVIMSLIIGVAIFSLGTSAVYVLNDLQDVEHDKRHSVKSKRPIASGQISLRAGWTVFFVLFISSLLGSIYLGPTFFICQFSYFVLAILYSSLAKSKPGLDVMLLTSLYVLRVITGAALISVPVSYWLLAFSGFFFLSLAWVKRYSEIYSNKVIGQYQIPGRGYSSEDGPIAISLGVSSAFCSILIFVLYVDSEQSRAIYENPQILWGVVPLLTYWLSRVWIETSRGRMNQDPILFTLRDIQSLGCGLGAILFVMLAHI